MKVTPEMLTAFFKLAAIGVEYANSLARSRGMNEAEILAAWEAAKLNNDRSLDDFIRDAGGIPPIGEPEPALYFDEDRMEVTTWPLIADVPRDGFSRGDRIYVAGPTRDASLASFYFVLPALVPRSDVVSKFNATLVSFI